MKGHDNTLMKNKLPCGNESTLCHEEIGEDIVAEASAKDEEVEDFMGAKVLMAGVEDREL